MYIHERENWWQFRYDTDSILPAVGAVRDKQGRLIGKLSALGFAVRDKTMLDSVSLDIIKSSEIEGEMLNHEHVRSSLARRLGLEVAGMPESSRYIEGVVDMMLDATQHYAEPLTDERLFGWHNVLFPYGRSGLYHIDVAQYRSGEMQVVSGPMGKERVHYKAPAPERVPEEMARLLGWINADNNVEPVLKAATAHFWFVTIHPFDDGNGRIARAITDMLLAKAEDSPLRFYSMSNAVFNHRHEYYDLLEKTQHGDGEITDWIVWFVERLAEALDRTEATLASVMRKGRFWEEHEATDFNPRQVKILNMLLDGFEGNMNTGRWSRICKCSRDTALKDATSLINQGVLRLGEGGGRSTTYLLNYDEKRL
ncbi:MAG: Fic family protein [Bacteroidaceae bacterium]|nr:Fic family protein [Bacteroidaceae bacterium]